jgi:hypothetical protein
MIPHDKEVADLVEENRQMMEENFAKIIQRGQELGEINQSHTALEYSRFLFNTIQGLKVMSKITSDNQVIDDILKMMIDLLRNK